MEEVQSEKKPRSNQHFERFKKGLRDWYGIEYEELIEKYSYCGGDGDNGQKQDKRHLNYWLMLFGLRPFPCKETECVCGVTIKENCFVVDETETNFIHMGNCCIKKFMPENKSGRTCEICQEPHKNRKYNLCNDCKTTNKKCKTCNEYFEFDNKKHELCDECYDEKIEKEQEELRRRQEEWEREREIRHKKAMNAKKGFINANQTATQVKQVRQCTQCNENYETTNMLENNCLCNACKIIKQEQINKERQEIIEENIKRNKIVGLMCHCNLTTVLRQVSKDNLNKGKLFYCCSRNREEQCDYFMWKDESLKRINKNFEEKKNEEITSNESEDNTESESNSENESDSNEELERKCDCKLTAVIREVKKDGPNKGRLFYTCPRYYDKKCGYFMWK